MIETAKYLRLKKSGELDQVLQQRSQVMVETYNHLAEQNQNAAATRLGRTDGSGPDAQLGESGGAPSGNRGCN